MTDLCELARKWTTDKALYYTPFYHELFKDRRKKVRKLLEFGIGYPELMLKPAARTGARYYIVGASLFMWEEYFPNASIYAVDIKPEIAINSGRIYSFCADQSRDESLRDLFANDLLFRNCTDQMHKKMFDVIIDDGSHEPEDQIRTAKICFEFELLAPGGVYIVEDAPPHDDEFLHFLPGNVEPVDFDENPEDPARLVVIRP